MASYIFLGGGTPWVYALATELAVKGRAVAVVSPYDARSFVRLRPRWPEGEPPATLQRTFWVLPPGYVGVLAPVFAPLLRWRLARVRAALEANGPPWVISPYPWFHRAVRDVPDEQLIYYNLDDYPLYNPPRAALIRQQEDEVLGRAALTICLSQQQVETLRARAPAHRRERIRHFPLGVVENYLNPQPECVPLARTVGYVGNLTDRVDWRLVGETAHALPDVEFIFVGGLEGSGGGGARSDWEAERDKALSLSNVSRIGPVRQEDVPGHYWNFGVNWIPYATDHAFNQAACPTKIMDGLASGRPVVSTDLPECGLYPEWISLAHTAEEMADQIRRELDSTGGAARAARQVGFARGHVWRKRAELLESWLLENRYADVRS